MAATVIVAGPVLIRTGTGAANALEDLGYTANQVEIDEDPLVIPVPGDEGGGDEGIPIDEQNLGEVHIIRFELTKFDAAVLAKLGAKFKGATAGTLPTVGSLYGGGSGFYRFLITATNFARNYLAVRPIRIHSVYGSKFTRATGEVIARPASGVLYNATTTG